MGTCFSFPPADAVVRRRAAEEKGDDGFSCEERCTGEFEGRRRPLAAPGQVPTCPDAVPRGRSERSRAATRSQTGGGLRLPGEYLLAAERSRGPDAVPVPGIVPEPA